jgi:putative peptide zinc metalloprotease protein
MIVKPSRRAQGSGTVSVEPPPAPPAQPQQAQPGAHEQPLRRSDGIDLMGEYAHSGFKEPHYLARRADGQVVQLTHLLFLIAQAADGTRSTGEIAEQVSAEYGRQVSADNVIQLATKRLRPLGVLTAADGTTPALARNDPMLALRFRARVVKPRAVEAITAVFRPLFHTPVVVLVLAALVGIDVWVFGFHGIAQAFRDMLYQPLLLFLVLALVILSAAFHECGHAAACRFGGARPGVMGAGIYMVWPAFYTDVTDAYRLDRRGRLRTDLGGLYFNCIFTIATAAAYFVTHYEPLLAIVLVQHIEMVHQLLPFLRLDGYYIVADLTGVPDMFSRVRPVLASLLPWRWRNPDPRVQELKVWARAAVTAWVLLTIPILLYLYGMLVVNLPRILATAWDSGRKQVADIGTATAQGKWAAVLLGVLQIAALALPIAGIALTLVRTGRRFAAATWARTENRPAARGLLLAGTAVALAYAAFAFVPRGHNYTPIQPGESGTLAAGTTVVSQPFANPGSGTTNGGDTPSGSGGGGAAPATQPSASPTSAAGSGGGSTTGGNPTPQPTTGGAAPSSTPMPTAASTP